MKVLKIAICLSVLFCVPAMAVVKCVALNSNSTCEWIDPEDYQSDWGATCNGISIRGIALCGHESSANGLSTGATTESVWKSSEPYQNRACWCKIVQPAVSKWVYAETNNAAGDCAHWCQDACAGKIGGQSDTDKAFRQAILGEFYE